MSRIYNTARNQTFDIEAVEHTTPEEAMTMYREGVARFLDIREESDREVEWLSFADMLYMPLSKLPDKLNTLPIDKTLLVVGKNGIDSTKAVNLLTYQGFEKAINVDGGLLAWRKAGLPLKDILPKPCGDCSSCSDC
ncbi:MAG: rhodanese-like domain-containing protein [Bacteroidales bacterium]